MQEKYKDSLITSNSKSPFAEAFRTLRTNIQFSGVDSTYRTLLVTSSGPGEGKTTTTCNLGVVLAQANNKVLIVDCDLRRPSVHKAFGLNNSTGVTNVLVNDLDPSSLAQETEVPRLHIVASGPIPPNPAELVGSKRMQILLSRARENFDFVLVDSPPVNMVTDAILLSPLVDGALLVIKSSSTRIDHAKEAQDKLEKVGTKLIGVVLNNVDTTSGYYYYYNYYYYTQSEGQEGKSKRKGKVASL